MGRALHTGFSRRNGVRVLRHRNSATHRGGKSAENSAVGPWQRSERVDTRERHFHETHRSSIKIAAGAARGMVRFGWSAVIEESLAGAVVRIEDSIGTDDSKWAWGAVRPLTLKHPLGDVGPLGRIFDLGPFAWGGNAATINQAAVSFLDPQVVSRSTDQCSLDRIVTHGD